MNATRLGYKTWSFLQYEFVLRDSFDFISSDLLHFLNEIVGEKRNFVNTSHTFITLETSCADDKLID